MRLLDLYLKIIDRLNPRKIRNRKKISKSIYILLHCPRSGGTYLKNVVNYYFGNLYEKNTLKKVEIPKYYSKPLFIFGHQTHNEFNPEIENQIKRFVLLREPNERVISRYSYLKNFQKVKNKKLNNIFNSDLTLSQYIKIIKDTYNDNYLTRMLINKINHNNFENEYQNQKTIYKELNNDDFNKAIYNIKKYNIIKTSNESINRFFSDELLLSEISEFDKKFKKYNYKNISQKNKKIENFEVQELSEINYYDNKLYKSI